MKKHITMAALLATIASFLSGCGSVNPTMPGVTTPLYLGGAPSGPFSQDGPEDIDTIKIDGKDRLIISSNNFRDKKSTGHMWLLSEDEQSIDSPLSVRDAFGKPLMDFAPHGIHVTQNTLGHQRIYVVNHAANRDEILKFALHGNTLQLKQKYPVIPERKSNRIKGLNDVFATPDGKIYATQLLPTGKLWYYDPQGTVLGWRAQPSSLFSNGLQIKDRHLYIASALPGKICRFLLMDGVPRKPELRFTKLKGGLDNFGTYKGDQHLIASHASSIRFLFKRLCQAVYSPTRVYVVDFSDAKKQRELRIRDGNRPFPIQAGSTALLLNDHIYIGQVYDNYVLKIALDDVLEVDMPRCRN